MAFSANQEELSACWRPILTIGEGLRPSALRSACIDSEPEFLVLSAQISTACLACQAGKELA
jgi:hypothetical protein